MSLIFSNLDFTLGKYVKLLNEVAKLEIPVYGIHDWITKNPKRGILIRHDIDRKARNSIPIAKVENYFGISTTYYFRYTAGSFKPKIINLISSLNHEIGYHYEDLSRSKGNYEVAENLFSKHLSSMRKFAQISTVCMHGNPFSPIDDRDLFKHTSLSKYNLTGEAFLSIDYDNIYYLIKSSQYNLSCRQGQGNNRVTRLLSLEKKYCCFGTEKVYLHSSCA